MRKIVFIVVLAKIILAGPISAEPQIVVRTVEDPQYPVRVKIEGVEVPMILEYTENFREWNDLLLVTPYFNGMEMIHPTAADSGQFFYRFRVLEEPIRFQPNLVDWSSHLGRYVSGRDLEVDIFGTRDEEGYPASVTGLSYRVGNRYLTVDLPSDASAPTAQPLSQQSAQPVRFTIHGYVRVALGGDCRLPTGAPVVTYKSTGIPYNGTTNTVQGQVQTRHIPEMSSDSEAVYRYIVPYDFIMPCQGPTDLQRYERGLIAGLNAAYFDPVSMSTNLLETLAGKRIPVWGQVLNGVVVGMATYNAILDDTPYDVCKVYLAMLAEQVEVQAYLQIADGFYLRSSSAAVELAPSPWKQGPDLTISADCTYFLEFYNSGSNSSHIRTTCHLNNFYHNPAPAKSNRVSLTSAPSSPVSVNTVHQFQAQNSWFASSAIRLISNSLSVGVVTEHSGATTGSPHTDSVTSLADAQYYFRIAAGTAGTSNAVIAVELQASTNVRMWLHEGQNVLAAVLPGRKAQHLLRVGQPYKITTDSRLERHSGPMRRVQSAVTVTLLGRPR